jgi:hypothetical protein
MKKLFVCSAIAISAAVLASCASGPDYSNLNAQAKHEMALAKKMNYLWRDTGKVLKKAEKTGKKKYYEEAIFQAKAAQEQAREQAHPAVWY